jgi:Putative adhesin
MNELVDQKPSTGLRSILIVLGSVFAFGTIGYGIYSAVDYMAHERKPTNVSFAGVKAVKLNLHAGDVRLRTATSPTGRVVGIRTISKGLRSPTFTEIVGSDGTLVLSSDCPYFSAYCEVDYTLEIPPGVTVTGALSGGDFEAAGMAGDLAISTAGGDVKVVDAEGGIDVGSAGGNVNLTRTTGRVRINSGGGNVTGRSQRGEQIEIDSSGGEISLAFSEDPTSISISSSGGEIVLALPPSRTPYAVDASTSGGDREISIATDPLSPRRMKLSSSGGDIVVSARPADSPG